MDFRPDSTGKDDPAEGKEDTFDWERAAKLGLQCVKEMVLPWYFGFYWLACFCHDYACNGVIDFNRITLPPQRVCEAWGEAARECVKDRQFVIVCYQGKPGGKIYPPYPFLVETGFPFSFRPGQEPSNPLVYGIAEYELSGQKHKVDGLFETDEDGNVLPGKRTAAKIFAPKGAIMHIHFGEKRREPSQIKVEFPTFLATDDVVAMAFKQIRAYREGYRRYLSHPILNYVGSSKVNVDEDVKLLRDQIRQEIAQYREGKLTMEDLLFKEWQRELKQKGNVALKLKNQQLSKSEAQTAIYYRVRRRFMRNGIEPLKPQKGWRSKLIYPE